MNQSTKINLIGCDTIVNSPSSQLATTSLHNCPIIGRVLPTKTQLDTLQSAWSCRRTDQQLSPSCTCNLGLRWSRSCAGEWCCGKPWVAWQTSINKLWEEFWLVWRCPSWPQTWQPCSGSPAEPSQGTPHSQTREASGTLTLTWRFLLLSVSFSKWCYLLNLLQGPQSLVLVNFSTQQSFCAGWCDGTGRSEDSGRVSVNIPSLLPGGLVIIDLELVIC